MMTKKKATTCARQMGSLHLDGEKWLVFRTADDALCNTRPLNTYNKGRYGACRASEKPQYEAGGCVFE
jgi:hypothetical protein